MNNEEIENEIWKDVPNFEGHYQASNLGKIRSLDRKIKSQKKGIPFLNVKGRILKQKTNKYGYLSVVLAKDHVNKYISVHQVIGRTFLDNPNNYPEINHKNKIKIDNRVENLEWCNGRMNKFHNWKIKSKQNSYPVNVNYDEHDMFLSEFRSMGKLDIYKVESIRNLYKTGQYTQQELADKFNISNQRVSAIVNFKCWKPE